MCDVLLAPMNQQVNGAQYWSGWSSTYTGTSFGIDQPGTVPYNGSQFAQIDTDIIPVGTFLAPYTPSNVEYKLSRPLVSGETVEIQARPNLTATFTSLGTDNVVAHTAFEFPTVLQNNQWLQFRVKLTSTAQVVTAGSFVIGLRYTIVSVGNTDFTLIGASSSSIGISFIATGVGSGTGTAIVSPSFLPISELRIRP